MSVVDEDWAQETCHELAARDLKAICRHRGFHLPAGKKADLVAALAPRLLEPTGAAKALEGLAEPWLRALHVIALAEEPPDLDQLATVFSPGAYQVLEPRKLFRQLADGLLQRGVVLCRRDWGEGLSALTFHLPEVHRQHLPPFPVSTIVLGLPEGEQMDTGASSGRFADFCRQALRAAAGGRAGSATGLLGRVRGQLSIKDGRVLWGSSEIPDLRWLYRAVRREWTGGEKRPLSLPPGGFRVATAAEARRSFRREDRRLALRTASHVLAHLPPGEGVTVADLAKALARLSCRLPEPELHRFCEDGRQAGLLLRRGTARGDRSAGGALEQDPCFRALPEASVLADQATFAFRGEAGGVRVDLEASAVAPLLELAAVSRARKARGELLLRPDLVRLGRAAPWLDSFPALGEARAACAAFDQAVRQVEKRHGEIVLHDGLLVLRIDDLGLRTLLLHRLGDALRELGGAYLAAPRGLAKKIEKLVRKEGFAARRVTS